jgi:glycerate 2-kinase
VSRSELRVVCAPDKFRGALTAAEAARALAQGVRLAGGCPIEHPVADGGEGTLDVLSGILGGMVLSVPATDALDRPVVSRILVSCDRRSAYVAAAEVVGLEPLSHEERDPMWATSYGLGTLLRAALGQNVGRIVVAVGGTANLDGGMGMLGALGADLRDCDRQPLRGIGADLARVASVDLTPARETIGNVELVLASDVESPLIGPNGAAYVFGPQKGASPGQVADLDGGMRQWSELVGVDPSLPGAGAAGGIGYALIALGASRVSGAEMVLDTTGFDATLRDANLCLTGEGAVDASTRAGKSVGGVLDACRRQGVPCVVLGGVITPESQKLYDDGAAAVLSIGRAPRTLDEALQSTAADLSAAARAVTEFAGAVSAR